MPYLINKRTVEENSDLLDVIKLLCLEKGERLKLYPNEGEGASGISKLQYRIRELLACASAFPREGKEEEDRLLRKRIVVRLLTEEAAISIERKGDYTRTSTLIMSGNVPDLLGAVGSLQSDKESKVKTVVFKEREEGDRDSFERGAEALKWSTTYNGSVTSDKGDIVHTYECKRNKYSIVRE